LFEFFHYSLTDLTEIISDNWMVMIYEMGQKQNVPL